MYCQKCGTKIEDEANYCYECGKATKNKKEVKDELQFTLKPEFNGLVSFSDIEMKYIIYNILGTVILGFLGAYIINQNGMNMPEWIWFVFFGVGFLLISLSSKYVLDYRTFKETEYRFFKNKLEYFEGFSTLEQKIVKYSNVTEIYMRRSIVQKKYNLGTIIILTPMTAFKGNGALSNGVVLKNIENPAEIYKKIRKAVNEVN